MQTELIGFSIRARWANITLEEARHLPQNSPLAATAEVFRAVAELVTSLEGQWRTAQEELERQGMNLVRARAIVGATLDGLTAATTTLDELAPRLGEIVQAGEIQEVRDRLSRIQESADKLRAVVERPLSAVDPDRMRRSLEEMERGEGTDVEELLRELTSKADQ